MTLPVKEEELWHQVSVIKNGADTTLVVDRASRTLRSNGDHSIKAALGVDPGDPESSASGGTGSGGSSSKQYGPRKDSDSMAFGDLYSNGYVFVGGLPSWYSEKMDSVVLPTTLLEPRLRGSVRSLKYRDMRSSSERQQDMMAYKVRNFFGFLKFIYSEKATKFCKIFTLLLIVCTVVKSKVKTSQNSVAFSEYMNYFTKCLYF